MSAPQKMRPKGPWTPEEIARNERAEQIRALRDLEKTPEERLEETIRLSRFMSELKDGLPSDVRA
jgi:hypothetical protein